MTHPFRSLLVALALAAPLRAATAYGLHQDLVYDGDSARRAQAIAAAVSIGSTVARCTLPWAVLEPTRGARDWSRADAVVDELRRAGLAPLFLLIGSPSWANGDADPFVVPTDEAAFAAWVAAAADFAGAAAARYRGRVARWEIGNEVNEYYFWKPTPDPARFARWYRALYAAVHANAPGARIALGGLTGLYASCCTPGNEFLTRVLDLGVPLDAISIHPYTDHAPDVDVLWQGNFSDVQRVHDLLVARGLDTPLWITEWGWPSDQVGVDHQAQWLATSLAMIRDRYPFVELATVFVDYDRLPEYHQGLFDAQFAPKPAATAFAEFARGVGQPAQGAPVVTLRASTASVVAPADIRLDADASAASSVVTGVEFYDGATRIASSAVRPFTCTWHASALGSHALHALASDDRARTTTSAEVRVVVTAPAGGGSGATGGGTGTSAAGGGTTGGGATTGASGTSAGSTGSATGAGSATAGTATGPAATAGAGQPATSGGGHGCGHGAGLALASLALACAGLRHARSAGHRH